MAFNNITVNLKKKQQIVNQTIHNELPKNVIPNLKCKEHDMNRERKDNDW